MGAESPPEILHSMEVNLASTIEVHLIKQVEFQRCMMTAMEHFLSS